MGLEKMFGFGRRVLLGAAIISALSFYGCSKDKKATGPTDGTGVKGLNTPSEILSNPYVRDVINDAKDEGLNITPETSIHPPVISGTYDLNGIAYLPERSRLAPGTWIWSNQTSKNHINTDYDEGFQIGSNVEGEIIRGDEREFTVYSILDIFTEGHKDRAAVIVDGRQDNKGNVSAIYIGTPLENEAYIVPSAGSLELTLRSGAAKLTSGNVDGAYLIGLAKKKLENTD